MNLAYCFIGKLPKYSIDTVHQARLFFDGPIYFIVSDLESIYIKTLIGLYNVNIIPYEDCKSNEFCNIISKNYNRFYIVDKLTGRENLHIYSFERFIVLFNLVYQYKLSDILFLELDNLIYDDPRNWLPSLSKKDAAYMFDDFGRCSSGICYIKNYKILETICNYMVQFIKTTDKFLSEMNALYEIWEEYIDNIQIIPTMWKNDKIPYIMYKEYNNYNDSIFDAASIGIFIGGMDPYHTDGKIVKGLKNNWAHHDYTQYIYEWHKDDFGRNIPYIFNNINNKWIKINNLHIHSKQLSEYLSKPLE